MRVTFGVPIVEIWIQSPAVKLKGGVKPIKQGPGCRGGNLLSPLKLIPIEAARADANDELARIILRQVGRQSLFVPALGSDWTCPAFRTVVVSAKYHIIGRLPDLLNAADGSSHARFGNELHLTRPQVFSQFPEEADKNSLIAGWRKLDQADGHTLKSF